MRRITAANIVHAIDRLQKNREYNYPNKSTKTLVAVVRVDGPEGPIVIKRWGTKKHPTQKEAKIQTISTEMIWRVANALIPDTPINFDRILGASYNTRSSLEALMLHTEYFYSCKPGRLQILNTSKSIQKGHKHVIWRPDHPHEQGLIAYYDTDIVISETAILDTAHEGVQLPISENPKLESPEKIASDRIHAQIQVTLVEIGKTLGFQTWVASNDHSIIYKNKRLIELESVVPVLAERQILQGYPKAAEAGKLIDCIWFRNGKAMPAVIEVEQSTGVTSGLTRMKNFKDQLPFTDKIRWVIAAPDSDREKVIKKASAEQFSDMNNRFFPYSAIQELYSLCHRRSITDVNDGFLDCFMENTTESLH